jgi:hypothetical protein
MRWTLAFATLAASAALVLGVLATHAAAGAAGLFAPRDRFAGTSSAPWHRARAVGTARTASATRELSGAQTLAAGAHAPPEGGGLASMLGVRAEYAARGRAIDRAIRAQEGTMANASEPGSPAALRARIVNLEQRLLAAERAAGNR